jgi:iron complex outermembrane receptor protein
MKSLVTRAALCVLILTISIPGLPLLAQETKPPAPAEKKAEDEKKPKVTEEMVVTARKREETVQEVPISVAAPTESQLRDRGAETLEDVSANVAGFTVQNLGPGQSQVAMRGVSAGQIVRDQPGVKEQVGVYLDESVISLSLFTPDIDLFDMSRIEVLRGPQGTLFGSGSLSGTVRYISNQPKLGVSETVGEFSGSSISGGSVGGSLKVATNAALSPTTAMRFAGYYTRYGGFIDAVQPNLSVKKDVNSGNRTGARLAFLFKPDDKLSITPRILYQKMDIDGWNRVDLFNILANPYTTTRPKVTLGDHRQFTQFKEPYTDKFTLGDVDVSYHLGGGKTLTSITSYSDRDVLVIRDATALTASITGGTIGLPANVFTLNAPLYDKTGAKGFTQELRLSGGTQRLNWVTGAFYSGTKRNYSQNLPVTGFTALSGIPTAGTKLAKTDELYKSKLHYDFKQSAVFGELNYSVSDRLDLTGGLRWYNFKEDRTQVFDGIFSDPIDSVGSTSAHGFAPRGIASFKLNSQTKLNAQISKGFRLGGINDPLLVPNCQPQDLITYSGHPTWADETLWNFEVGEKSTVMNGRGTFNAAAYYMDIKNLQATLTAGTCSSRIILNVPKARTTGVESEFEIAPNDDFDFAVSGSYNKSQLRSSVTAADAKGVQQIVPGLKNGNRLPTVPEFQMTAAATYRHPVGGSVGYLTGVYQHIGDRYTQIGDQAPGFGTVDLAGFKGDIGGPYTQPTFNFNPKLPAYDILNLRLGILINKWDTALFINNVTNETALLALDQERGSRARVGYLTNQPRTIGISTRVNF